MDKYIEREALIKESTFMFDYALGHCKCVLVEDILNIPAADVVEVVHGEWVHIKDYGGGKCSGHCSVCWTLQEADNPSALKGSFRYCRWCGAKMDGGSDET